MGKKVELILLVLAVAVLVMVSKNLEKYVSSDKVDVKENTVIIDPGHGSSDPGKVGVNGALEKDVNLKIAKKVKKMLEKKNIQVVMTREKDEAAAELDSGNKKIEDMKKRVKLINDTRPEIVVSIHQNSYHEPEIHGAQVFYYSHSEDGEKAAKIMQEALLSCDKENTRQAKANDTYYLLKKTEVPTIIVECGFLSNPAEAEKLVTEEYQKAVADAIVTGIETCMRD